MPTEFLKCVRTKGSKIRTVKPSPGKYLHICYIGNKSFPGEIKETKKEKKRNIVKKIVRNK